MDQEAGRARASRFYPCGADPDLQERKVVGPDLGRSARHLKGEVKAQLDRA